MTASEMKDLFLLEYDAATSFTAPAWEDDEISAFINNATLETIDEFYKANDLKHISELIVNENITYTITHPVIPNAKCWSFTPTNTAGNEFLYYLNSTSEITRTNPSITSEIIPNDIISVEDSYKFIKTAINKVWFLYPKCYFEYYEFSTTGLLTVIYDSYTTPVTYGSIQFIKKPVFVNITNGVDSTINPVLHKGIVKRAVQLAIESIKGTKIQAQQ